MVKSSMRLQIDKAGRERFGRRLLLLGKSDREDPRQDQEGAELGSGNGRGKELDHFPDTDPGSKIISSERSLAAELPPKSFDRRRFMV